MLLTLNYTVLALKALKIFNFLCWVRVQKSVAFEVIWNLRVWKEEIGNNLKKIYIVHNKLINSIHKPPFVIEEENKICRPFFGTYF